MRMIDFDSLAQKVLEETDRLVRRYGSRLAGSEAGRAVARELADRMEGFCDRVRMEEFEARPASFYAYTKILPCAYVLGLGALFLDRGLYLLPALGIAFGIALMVSQFALYGRLGDGLFPARTCVNVEGVVEPEGEAEYELLLSGHHDSAPVARIYSGPFQKFYALAIFAPYPFFLLELGLLIARAAGGVPEIPGGWTAALLAGLPFAAAYFLMIDTRRGSPGAGDNLAASVLCVEIARELAARKRDLLRRTRVRVLSFDAEEAGLRGSAAYLRSRAGEIRERPAYMLNFDSLYDAAHLQALDRDVNGFVRLSREVARDAAECLRVEGYEARVYSMVFGGTDAAEAAQAGIAATSVIAMPTAVVREGLVYHTPRDTVSAVGSDAVEA
ncbi:MAG: M28 family peptidase, partial [Treponema sp.]|nr:M28 family peptidase [Treponema sp.]